MKLNRLALPLLLAALAVSPARADVLLLKGGQRFEGDVTDKAKTFEIKVGDSVISIAKGEVLKHIPSIAALSAEAEKLHDQARLLYEEAIKPDTDSKTSNEQLKKGVELLRKAADLYQEAREVYADEKQSILDNATVKLLQEMRLYRDKMSSELAKSIAPTAPAPAPESKEKPEAEAKTVTPASAAPAAPKPAKPTLLELLPLAKAGNIDAMYSAGLLFEVEEWKSTEGEKWLRAAADKGHLRAQAHLALMAFEGHGKYPDSKEAQKWLAKADAKNEPMAKVFLAKMLFEGVGGPRSLRRADDLCEKAYPALRMDALGGDPEVLTALGWMHLEGLGAAQNGEKALLFLKGAAELGDVRAMMMIGMMYDTGRGVAANRAEAVKAYHAAAEKGYAPAQAAYAEIHDQNFYRKNNPGLDKKLAREWFLKATAQGHPLGQFWMGWFHIRGYEGPKDEKEGIRLWGEALKTATGKLRLMILNDLGYCAEQGLGGPKSIKEAAKYWQEAADLGHPMSQGNMGWYYDTELRNLTQAFKWYDLAARQGFPKAVMKMGDFCRSGQGTQKNLQEAERWYAVAVQINVTGADTKLKEVQLERAAGKR
jgi:hypothetical protein